MYADGSDDCFYSPNVNSVSETANPVMWSIRLKLDGWYYRKMAEATRLIADFEDFFRQGEKPDSGQVIHSYGNRISSFATRKDGINFMVIFNHNSQSARTVTVKLPSAMVSHRYPDGERLSGAAEFQVEVPALDVAVIVSSKDDAALRHILNCRD